MSYKVYFCVAHFDRTWAAVSYNFEYIGDKVA